MRLPKYFNHVNQLIDRAARRRGVRIYEFANVGNHLHLLIKLPRRGSWASFIRKVTGRVAQLTATRWAHRPFTRVISGWRKAYRIVKDYVTLNRIEAERGLSRAQARILMSLEGQLIEIT